MMRPTRFRSAFRGLLSLCVLSALSVVAINQGFAQSPQERAKQVRQSTFDVVWKTVSDKYFDPQFGGVDWPAVKRTYEPQLTSIRDDAEFYDLLSRMLAEIKVSHLRILNFAALERQLARSVVTRGVALRDVGGQVVVTRVVERSAAANAGIRMGYALSAIDGSPVTNARSAEATLAADTATQRLTVLNESDESQEILINHQLPPAEHLESAGILSGVRRVLVESGRLTNGIGYIHFTNFIAPLKRRLTTTLESMRDAPGVIIDLRGNSGGETEVGLTMAGMLVKKETQLAIQRTRKGEDYSYKAKPNRRSYAGPVVILLDEESASESEQVTAGLQAAGRVMVIGRRSRGEDMDATFQELPMDTIGLLYPIAYPRTPQGVPIEGRGVIPDIEVVLTREELLKGRDPQLQAALAYLQRLNAARASAAPAN
jgi:carboxyl-terminal processing protease